MTRLKEQASDGRYPPINVFGIPAREVAGRYENEIEGKKRPSAFSVLFNSVNSDFRSERRGNGRGGGVGRRGRKYGMEGVGHP